LAGGQASLRKGGARAGIIAGRMNRIHDFLEFE
jgi:hypothetical protein